MRLRVKVLRYSACRAVKCYTEWHPVDSAAVLQLLWHMYAGGVLITHDRSLCLEKKRVVDKQHVTCSKGCEAQCNNSDLGADRSPIQNCVPEKVTSLNSQHNVEHQALSEAV